LRTGSHSDLVTITLPRSIVPELPTFANALNDRMHDLLERNTEGTLSESEHAELESLVQMAQFAQIFVMATQQQPGWSASATSGSSRTRRGS
jgi:hypothetical protein